MAAAVGMFVAPPPAAVVADRTDLNYVDPAQAIPSVPSRESENSGPFAALLEAVKATPWRELTRQGAPPAELKRRVQICMFPINILQSVFF